MSESLDQRRRALEEAFFAEQNEKLRQRLIEADRSKSRKAALAAASGVADEAVLDRLAALDIAPETMAALSLVPLVLVAWADGEIEAKERDAVLRAAAEAQVAPGSPGHGLLADWLTHKPEPALFEAWSGYTRAVAAQLPASERDGLRAQVLGRARAVAESAGGFLGLGPRVSSAEAAVLGRLESAFAA